MHLSKYFENVSKISKLIDLNLIEDLVQEIKKLKNNKGRIFFIGVGGSAANCSHAVNDFRKLCLIESYCPLDNVSELTARINDEGWETSILNWLKVSNFDKNDAIFIMSVGGGNISKNVSVNLIEAMNLSLQIGAKIFGIVGRDGGYLKQKGNNVILIPNTDEDLITPLAESFQAVVWHSIVSHPELQINKTKW
tara:strand:- start:226 stop:807 length:582 start_codon:yes stop_codon:yes gene_type:complete